MIDLPDFIAACDWLSIFFLITTCLNLTFCPNHVYVMQLAIRPFEIETSDPKSNERELLASTEAPHPARLVVAAAEAGLMAPEA
jgi:hypothetical protein